MQEFFTDTLKGRFVKSLLMTERIPFFDVVDEDTFVIEGCNYIYKNFVIYCTKSGFFSHNPQDALYPSDNLYPSNYTFIGAEDGNYDAGSPKALYKVTAYFDASSNSQTYSYKSNVNWYDSETHMYLGRYLRYIKNMYGIDMMPYYNCNNYFVIDSIRLKESTSSNPNTYYVGNDNRYKVFAVPIKFGETYNIHLSCTTKYLCRSVIFDGQRLILDNNGNYLSDDLATSFKSVSGSRFNSPIEYSVSAYDKRLYTMQKYLYLLIQIPIDNESALVVIEKNKNQTNINSTLLTINKEQDVPDNLNNDVYLYNPSLINQRNSKHTYAFSDRLIEYLLNNVIHPREQFTGNIAQVQEALIALYPDSYAGRFEQQKGLPIKSALGVWDEGIKTHIIKTIEECKFDTDLEDMDGFINKDVESLLRQKSSQKGGLIYGE